MKLRTYIVEDNATIRENLIGTLEELASLEAVGVAETEDEGKEWLQAHGDDWDLAIVDLFLRQGSGLGVLAACRDRRAGQKVVVLSNYATPDVRMRCAQLGWTRCSTNPMKLRRWWITASSSARARPSVNQAVLERVVGQIAVGREAHFFHQACAVGAHGFHRQGE